MAEWHEYIAKKREEELSKIIVEEKLKEPETRKFIENAFRDGEIKTTGTDIDKLMPPVSRFGSSKRTIKKQGVIDKLKSFFEKFFGVGGSFIAEESDNVHYTNVMHNQPTLMVAEDKDSYKAEKDSE